MSDRIVAPETKNKHEYRYKVQGVGSRPNWECLGIIRMGVKVEADNKDCHCENDEEQVGQRVED